MPQDTLVRILCPNLACQRVLGVPAEARGKLVRCRNCAMVVRVPQRKETQGKDSTQSAENASAD